VLGSSGAKPRSLPASSVVEADFRPIGFVSFPHVALKPSPAGVPSDERGLGCRPPEGAEIYGIRKGGRQANRLLVRTSLDLVTTSDAGHVARATRDLGRPWGEAALDDGLADTRFCRRRARRGRESSLGNEHA
jgi:hypothetical protein